MNSSEELAKRLAGRLRDLRKAAGLSQAKLADLLGATQSKVTKIESGRTTPSVSDLDEWAKATKAASDERTEVAALLHDLEAGRREWRAKFRRGQHLTQREYDQMARESKLVRNFETAAVPGLLQIPDYARLRVLEGQRQGASPDPEEIAKAVAGRLKRAEALYDTSRTFEFLIAEPVFHWRLAPAPVLRAQFTRIITLADLPNVSVSVLPYDADLRDTPQHGFILFDDLAVVETLSNEEKYPGDDKAEQYLSLFTDFMALAKHGLDAQRHIEAAARTLG